MQKIRTTARAAATTVAAVLDDLQERQRAARADLDAAVAELTKAVANLDAADAELVRTADILGLSVED